tara:strand:+ start:784 stop:1359 length:576 start_codon:yes stop_codon:yes gene_type:complete
MQQDIRDRLKEYKEEDIELSASHAPKFEALLQSEIPQQKQKKQYLKWISVAASVVLLVSLGIKLYSTKTMEEDLLNTETSSIVKKISLGSISPEFKTIETYYKNSIKIEIGQLEMTEENTEIVDGYLLKIAELTKEYKSLTKELNTKGVNDATIDALISNLQLRLQLIKRLKKQLKKFKNLNTTQNETKII